MTPQPAVFERLEDVALDTAQPVVLSVGTFDGVHLAHQRLIDDAVRRAREMNGLAALLTFRNHPRAVVSPDSCPPLLTDWETKKKLLLERGVDVLVGLTFSPEFAHTPAEDFVREAIASRFHAKVVISGPDFHFGRDRCGNPALLREMGPALGYVYIAEEPVTLDGEKVSSTRIRAAIRKGKVEEAERLLTRPHYNRGNVVPGDGLGRMIGFPTANLAMRAESLLPADGVYAVEVAAEEAGPHPGMMNIGFRPTVNGREHRAEVHLIGYSGDLRDRVIEVRYRHRLREEKKFAGLEELKGQLEKDRRNAVDLLTR